MARFLLRRIGQALLVLLVMSFVIYGLIGLMPGDPIDLMMAGNPGMTPEAAARLRALADSLAKHNSVEFSREGGRVTVAVPDEVRLKVEVELGDDNEIEIELTW